MIWSGQDRAALEPVWEGLNGTKNQVLGGDKPRPYDQIAVRSCRGGVYHRPGEGISYNSLQAHGAVPDAFSSHPKRRKSKVALIGFQPETRNSKLLIADHFPGGHNTHVAEQSQWLRQNGLEL